MCRGCVLLFILFLIAESIWAQPLHLAIDSMESSIFINEDIIEQQNYVINDLSETVPIQWQKNFTAPDSWTVNLCDDIGCFGEYATSNVLYINAGDSSQLKSQFFADVPGEARLNVSVSGLDVDGTLFSVQTSYTLVKTTETSIPQIRDILKIYPNPTEGIINISSDQDYTFKILDFSAREYLNGALSQGNSQLSINHLISGSYILRLYSESSTYQFIINRL